MSSPPLTIHLFGPMRVLVQGEPLPRVRTRSVEWLLALLVLRHGRAVDRSWLAGTLWLESEENQALRNLREDLVRLRKALGSESGRLQSPTRDTLTFDLTGAEVDILAFDAALQAGDEASLRRAVALYTGPVLEGCYAEWVAPERENREQSCLAALETLAGHAEQRGDFRDALALLRRAEEMDGLRDSTQRRLMRVLVASGDRPAALMAYRTYRLRLRNEMNVEPDEETTRLFQQLVAAGRGESGVSGIGYRVSEDGRQKAEGRSWKSEEPTADRRPPATEHPTPDTRHPIPNALPHPITTLIGREEEVEAVRERLRESRLVTLVGAGGVGKTRLAMEVAAQMEAAFDAGAAWVELAPVTDGALLLPAIGAALRIRQEQGTEGEVLTAPDLARLSAGRFLLALDNCEHILDDAAAVVERLLQASAGLCVLATSRQRLGLAGEVVWHVPSLSAPQPNALPAEDAGAVTCALTYPAVRLFVERAGAARPGFRLADRANAAAVCTLCRRLDGIPLAIELAAARVGALTPGQLAARLDDRFALLTQGARTALPRQKTLRALIDWSYDLLTEDERALLRRLSVFADGWTLDAAEAICKDEGRRMKDESHPSQDSALSAQHSELDLHPSSFCLHPSEVLDVLTSLTDKSLVVSEEQAGGLRYRMLETIREYAQERLRQLGEEEEARRCYADWVVTFVESARGELLGSHLDAAQDRLEPELGNIRDALAWARTSAAPPGMYLRLTAVLWPFWDMRGYMPEGRAHLVAALERPDLPDSPARAYALLGIAYLRVEYGFAPDLAALAQESLERFRALGDVSGTAAALLLLGHIFLYKPDYAAAHALLTEGLGYCREAGWVQASALVLVHLGLLAQIEGNAEQSQALREEGWSLLDRGDDGSTPVYCLNFMNTLATTLYVAAGERALLERSLALARKMGKKRRVMAIVHALAMVAEWQGDSAFAIACFREAAQTYREVGNEYTLSEVLQHLGNLYYRLGDYRSACPVYTESLELFRKLGYTVGRAGNNLGSTLFHLGEAEPARRLHREALIGYGENIEGIAWSLERLGVVEAFDGEPLRAAQLLGAAARTREEFGGPLDSWDQEDWDRAVAEVRATLGEEAFAAAYAEGRAMSREQAIDYALLATDGRQAVGSRQ